MNEYLLSLLGGAAIGLSSLLLMRSQGKIAGISGIVDRVSKPFSKPEPWQVQFTLGLLFAGILAAIFAPESLKAPSVNTGVLILAGLLVGVGTRLANGCTSGHGICGLSRLSGRSVVAVATFMSVGILTRLILGGIL